MKKYPNLSSRFFPGLSFFSRGMFGLSIIFAVLILLNACNMEKPSQSKEASVQGSQSESYTTQTKESQVAMSPQMALDMLKEGNDRFTTGSMISRDLAEQVRQTSTGQYPFAAIVSCIDSRIPTEVVFDQGIGDIFNARIAGNFVDPEILGSLEFATKVAGAKLIVVMGHTECGAVKGACDHVEMGNLTTTLSHLKPALEAVTDITEDRNSKNPAFVQKVADANVELTMQKIMSDSPVIREMAEKGEVQIVGAMYDVATGKVSFTR